MKIKDVLNAHAQGVSFEFFPPKTANGLKALGSTSALLEKYSPLYVSMTYGAGGSTQERTKEATYLLMQTKGLVVMPHLTSIGAHAQDVSSLLDEYKSRGIENIMALRGDPPQGVSDFDFSKQEFRYALDLVRFIKKYGHFCIGTAVYPEGHIENDSLEKDIDYTKMKIDAGADFAVTQMFFDNGYFYRMLDRMKKRGVMVPVLPGILPLTDVAKVRQFCSVARTTVPAHIEQRMCQFADPADMARAGLEYTIAQCQDLIDHGFKRLHFFTLNKPEIITRVLDAIYARIR